MAGVNEQVNFPPRRGIAERAVTARGNDSVGLCHSDRRNQRDLARGRSAPTTLGTVEPHSGGLFLSLRRVDCSYI